MTDSANENLTPDSKQESPADASATAAETQDNAFFSEESDQKTVASEGPNPLGLAEAQAAEWKAKVIYLSAEIENMRKRFTRERSELVKMASEDVLKSLMPVFDNMTYALRAAKDSEKTSEPSPIVAKLIQGLEMTLKHFEQTLEQQGVTGIPSVGTNFDPTLHEAVGQSELAEFGNDVVSNEVQKGFKLYSRVLRPARVLVNKK